MAKQVIVHATAQVWECGHFKGEKRVALTRNKQNVFLDGHLVQDRTTHGGKVMLTTTEIGRGYGFKDTEDEKAAETVQKFYS